MWYVLGGELINIGPPMHIFIDRNTELGCEIQYSACRKYGIMISIHFVKTSVEGEANSISEDDYGVLNGT